jgi:type II secretory pathway component PulF
MPIYSYEATDKDGEEIVGEINATTEAEAVGALARKKLAISLIKEKTAKSAKGLEVHLFERFTTLDRIIMVRNLAVTIKAGLSILESLEILINDASKKIIKEILLSAKGNVQNGQPFSKTFDDYKKLFPPIFVGMVKAGELSGELDKSLEELSAHMNKEYALVKKVKSALAYPIVLLLASFGIVGLLLGFVLPRLTKTFAQSNMELPAVTRGLIYLSDLVSYSLWLDAGLIAAVTLFFTTFRKTSAGRKFFSGLVLKLPVAKNLFKKVILVRFTRTLGSLVASGLSIVEALELSSHVVGNYYYETAVAESINDIKNGIPLSECLRRHPDLFPNFLTSLITVGEKTGTLESVLKTFSDFYDDEVDGSLKDLTTFLEPVLLLIMGLIVGLIAIAILMPIYQMVGKFV